MSVALSNLSFNSVLTRRILQRQNAVEHLLFYNTYTNIDWYPCLSFLTLIYVKFTFSATFIDVCYFVHKL